MKIVFGLDGDEEIPVVAVTPPGGNAVAQVKGTVEAGKRYYVFGTIPFDFSNGIVVNFAEAKTCLADDDAQMTADIIAMLETPPLNMISEP